MGSATIFSMNQTLRSYFQRLRHMSSRCRQDIEGHSQQAKPQLKAKGVEGIPPRDYKDTDFWVGKHFYDSRLALFILYHGKNYPEIEPERVMTLIEASLKSDLTQNHRNFGIEIVVPGDFFYRHITELLRAGPEAVSSVERLTDKWIRLACNRLRSLDAVEIEASATRQDNSHNVPHCTEMRVEEDNEGSGSDDTGESTLVPAQYYQASDLEGSVLDASYTARLYIYAGQNRMTVQDGGSECISIIPPIWRFHLDCGGHRSIGEAHTVKLAKHKAAKAMCSQLNLLVA